MSGGRGGNAPRFDSPACIVLIALGIAAFYGIGGWDSPAGARSVESISIRENETVEKDYSAISGSNPGSVPRDPATCESVVYCDSIRLVIQVPASYTPQNRYSVNLTLTWPNPSVSNLDLYLYDRDKTTQMQYSATANPSENVAAYDPPGGTYYVVVLNAGGVNSGYRLKAQFATDPGASETTSPSTARPSNTVVLSESPAAAVSELVASPIPMTAASPRPVASPGTDGNMKNSSLESLGRPQGHRAKSYAFVFAGFWILAIAAGVVVTWRLRRRARFSGQGAEV